MGQGNKKRNRHNRKGYKSIGSKVGKALGGHLSKQGKLGGGAKKGGGFSFGDFKKSIGKFFTKPGYAHTMGDVTGKLNQLNKPSDWKVKQFAKKNIDITKQNPSFRVNIDTQTAINNIKNDTVRNWINKYAPQSIKNLTINHQMYSPSKIKPTDPNYNRTGTGNFKLDPDTEKYIEWVAKVNPTGMTKKDAEKLYANHLKSGMTLEQAMRSNPAETGSFYALIDDDDEDKASNNTTKSKNTTKGNNMTDFFTKYGVEKSRYDPSISDTTKSLAISDNIEYIFNNAIGRHPTTAEKKKATASITSGSDADYQALMDSIITGSGDQAGAHKEYQGRLAAVTANPNITEAELDALPTAYVHPMSNLSGGSWAGWQPWQKDGSSKITEEMAKQMSGDSGKTAAHTDSFQTMGEVYTALQNASKPSQQTGGGQQQQQQTTGGLTMADLNSWWSGLDKPWEQQQQQTNQFDQFMEFMKALQGMGGFGGGMGYGYPNMGYGGYAPGGVAAANPYGNMMNFMNAFKSLGQGTDKNITNKQLST